MNFKEKILLQLQKIFRSHQNIETKEALFKRINDYYSERNKAVFPADWIQELSNYLADYFFKQYADFKKNYPKSMKRYEALKMSDLENPVTHDIIMAFVYKEYPNDYIQFCAQIFGMTKEAFLKYEASREAFHKM